MKRYPTYKNSGIEWIGEIPEHWEVVKLKYLVKEALKYGANESATESNPDHPRYIRITDFDSNGKLRDETFKSLPPDKAEEYLLDEGDVLFARSGATVGKTFLFKGHNGQACFAGYLIKASHNESIIPEYLYYFTKSGGYDNWKNSIFDQATIQNISAEKYNNLQISIGPTEEQTQIANYLDHQTGIIDQLIEKKKLLIEKLKEQRQAIINEAVTKGLDPNAKLKDSGIEWIGEIPEHWEVVKLKHLCASYGRIGFRGYSQSDIVPKGKGAITLSPSNITPHKMVFENNTYLSWEKYEESPEIKVFNGDILIVKTGSTYGKVGLVQNLNESATINPQLLVMKNFTVNNEYIFYLFNTPTFDFQIETSVVGSTIPTISQSKIMRFSFGIPPSKEQTQIANYLDRQTGIIDQIVEKTQLSIEKLEEQRRSIISEAVTGKVDVRDWEKTKIGG